MSAPSAIAKAAAGVGIAAKAPPVLRQTIPIAEAKPPAEVKPPAEATPAAEARLPAQEAKKPGEPEAPRVEVAEVDLGDDLLDLERAGSLPSIVDEATGDTFNEMDEAPTAKPHVVELDKVAAATPAALAATRERPIAQPEDAESTDEATLLRPSPLDEQLEMGEQSIDEPTLLRPSPLDEQLEMGEQSIDEPTLLRPSPLEQSEQPPKEPSAKGIRVALSPELIAQAQSELAGSEAIAPKLAVPREPPVIRELPLEPEDAAPPKPPRPGTTTRPRSAPLWGWILAVVALVAAFIVVAKDKDWRSRLMGAPAPSISADTTAAPGDPEVPTPSLPTTVTAVPAGDAEAPPVADASADQALAADAAVPTPEADASAAAVDAGAPVDAGTTAVDAGLPADAGAAGAGTAQVAPPTAAPAGDPAALPERKGYLVVSSTASVHVYVQGAKVGLTNESLEVDCGPKFVRLGDPPPTPAPGGAPAGVKWRSEGKSVVVACRAVTTMTLAPSP